MKLQCGSSYCDCNLASPHIATVSPVAASKTNCCDRGIIFIGFITSAHTIDIAASILTVMVHFLIFTRPSRSKLLLFLLSNETESTLGASQSSSSMHPEVLAVLSKLCSLFYWRLARSLDDHIYQQSLLKCPGLPQLKNLDSPSFLVLVYYFPCSSLYSLPSNSSFGCSNDVLCQQSLLKCPIFPQSEHLGLYLDTAFFVPTCAIFRPAHYWVTLMTLFVCSPCLNFLVTHNYGILVSHLISVFFVPTCAIFVSVCVVILPFLSSLTVTPVSFVCVLVRHFWQPQTPRCHDC